MLIKHKKITYYISTLILFAYLIFSCAPAKNYKTLSLFFDGVPDPSKDSLIAKKDSAKSDSLNNTELITHNVKSEYVFHPPYKERTCEVCHDKSEMGKLNIQQQELCFTCHENFNTKYKYLHGPAASGNCTGCHSPHMAKFNKLLLREGQQLCLFCHDKKQVLKNEVHTDIKETNCTECHNPHGGDDKLILK